MRIITCSLCVLTALLTSCSAPTEEAANEDFTKYVNPFIGTDFTGNTYPGAQAPFGMVQLSPDNGLSGWDRIAGYYYPDSTIAGFSHTHLSGTGAGDLYDISFMPATRPYSDDGGPLGVHSKFSHDSETASAGYYKVTLADYGIDVELTATPRVGIQRYTFPAADASIFLNLAKSMNWDATDDSEIELVDSVTIRGYRFSEGWARGQKVYFYTRFSTPYAPTSEVTTSVIKRGGKEIGKGCVARLDFTTTAGQQITLATALSGTSMEAAEKNLLAEVPALDFDECHAQAQATWNAELGKVRIETTDDDQRTVFYTALYHSMIAPTIYSDVDGSYYGPDHQVHKTDGWVNYSTFSLWDTFRAAHPLFTYTETERVADMVQSFIAFYEQSGKLPVWNMWGSETEMMIGYHSVPIIADAYLKGITGFDAEKALAACVASANIDSYRGIGLYKKNGYIPYDIKDEHNSENWSLSRTLEYAYDDWCIAKMAEAMGKQDIADEFYARSKNYRNVYNPATSFMQPRDSKGNFQPGFKADEYTPHICESNGWQYFWSVQHDIDGLAELVGGKQRLTEKLDSMFTYRPADEEELPIFSTGMIGQYAQGNEPSHHVAYIYNNVGQPHKTQQYVRQIMDELYLNSPAGLCGNEDCGQTSAWYVFSAMGFYPVNPASGEYEIGSPLFPKVELRLINGKTFTVIANGASHENKYVQSVKLDGVPYDKSYITHEQIMSGATLEMEMGSQPAEAWY